MSVQDIASLGKMLAQFLALFADCFSSIKGTRLFAIYVAGLLSEVQRKNVEAIALKQNVAPRTLQRLLQSIKWDHQEVIRRCRTIIAKEHPDNAIGVVDETGTAKSGSHTACVKRQYNGNRGKIENSVVSVALSYATNTFQCLIAARMYMPEEWANDTSRRKKLIFLTRSPFSPSRRLHWNSLMKRVPTASESRHGLSMKTTAVMATF